MTLLQRIGLVFIAMALSGMFGAFLGYRYAKGQVAVTQVEELKTQITVINDQVKEDTQLIAVQAKRRVHETRKAVEVEQKGVMDAALKATVSCNRDVESYGLLLDAINTANGEGNYSGLPAGLPKAPLANEFNGSGYPKLGVPVDQGSR